jgi:ABC-type Zn uptake system ZnuABC Zn-binding protein ZnuA
MWRKLVGLLVVVGLLGCLAAPADPWGATPQKRVLTSFAPLACFAQNVAGPYARVLALMTATGPHDYDPSVQDAQKVATADLFVINGLQLDDPLANKMRKATGSKSRLLALGEQLPKGSLLEAGECACCKHDHDHDHGHDHSHAEYDPHVWLGLPEAVRMVTALRDEFKQLDPSHAADYDANATAYIAKLTALHTEAKASLKDLPSRKLISFHGALGYFARAFDLEIVDVVQQSAGADPSAQQMAKLITTGTKNNVRVITTEPQYGAKAVQALIDGLKKNGVAAQAVVIDPLETADATDLTADWYERKMKQNVANLVQAFAAK